jgi:hypothetical protein
VLATRGKVRIAFEVQLSGQGQAKTRFREDRYEDAAVLPWWIVSSRRNSGSGFGSRPSQHRAWRRPHRNGSLRKGSH